MTKRTINTGVGTYIDKRGNSRWGYRGDEVDVNDEFLEEFDEHNLVTGTGEVPVEERVGVDVISPKAVEADRKAEEKAAAKAAESSDDEEEDAEEDAAPKKRAAAKKA